MQRKAFSDILKRNIIFLSVACTIFGCSQPQENTGGQQQQEHTGAQQELTGRQQQQHQEHTSGQEWDAGDGFLGAKKPTASSMEANLEKLGLVNIHTLDDQILVDLKYSTTDNFVGIDVYGDLQACYLQPQVAEMLVEAQRLLSVRQPGLKLLLFDCARPLSVQQILWDTLQKPEEIKHLYVADPEEGSIHNYGSAVDLTIANQNGQPLDMGTDYDHFGPLAYPSKESELLASGELTKDQIANRNLLREVMINAGFTIINTEWWHFNAFSRERAQELFDIIE